MAAKKTFSTNDFSGGLNQRVNATMIKDNQSPDLLNCYIDQGAIVKRSGCRRWNQTAIAAKPVTSLHRYYREDGTKKLISLCGTKLYSVPDNGGAAVELTGATFTDGKRLEFSTYINNLYMTNVDDGYFKYDNATITAPVTAPAAKWIVPHGDNRMWAANSDNERSRVWFCADSDPSTWAINDDFFDVSSDDGDSINGLVGFMEDLLIFKDNSIWVAQGTYDPVNELTLTKRVTDAGCVAGRSLVTINNRVYFLGKEGIYEFDGVAARIISEPIEDIIRNINPSQKQYACAVGADSKYYLSYASLGSSINTEMLVYDTLARSWVKFNGKYAEAAEMLVLSGADDGNEVLVGTSQDTGMIYELNVGNSDDGDSGTATSGGASTLTQSTKAWATNMWAGNTLQITAGTGGGQTRTIASNTATELTVSVPWVTQPDNTSVYTVVGDAIDFYYYTKHFSLDVPESRKKFKKIWVYADAGGDYNLTLTYFFDLATTGTNMTVSLLGPGAKWGSAVWGTDSWGGTSMINERQQAQGKGRYFQFRFANSGAEQPVTVYGLSTQMKVKRPK
jgi:hypothetical protein